MGSLYRRTKGGNWYAGWTGGDGRPTSKTTGTKDRRLAEERLRAWETHATRIRDGYIDPRVDKLQREAAKPIDEIIDEYLVSCERAKHDGKSIEEKRRHLLELVQVEGVRTWADMTPAVLERNMAVLKRKLRAKDAEGKALLDADGKPRFVESDEPVSARTKNYRRQTWVALEGWLLKQDRIDRRTLASVPMIDERDEKHRVRRALSDHEVARLIAVARERDAELGSTRAAWYLLALHAGLRRKDLRQLRWGDVNLDAGTITIALGKAKRTDTIPIHPQLAEELRRIRPSRITAAALAAAPVFPTWPTDETRRSDFERAGIGPDAEGRVADLHALRTTLGTRLARAGVAPQVARGIMRHSSYQTTLKSYTVLGLQDHAAAIGSLSAVGLPAVSMVAVGGDSSTTFHVEQSGRGRKGAAPMQRTGQDSTKSEATRRKVSARVGKGQTSENRPRNGDSGPDTDSGAEGTRTLNFQLAKLALSH